MTLTVEGKRCDPFIQGTAMLDALPRADAFALLDGIADQGGTSFDLANNYGAGLNERIFGAWLAQRGAAERLFLVTKGGHPELGRARISREDVRADLEQSLDSLGVETIDLYLLHRDDERVPVGEIVTFLDDFRAEGLIRAYGGSNWRVERIAAAQAFAREHGLAGMAASSPHFSLAAPTEAPWPGCVSIAAEADPAGRTYYADTGLPVLAWSSLAMGYFALTGGDAPQGRERTIGARVFATPDNAARRERARRLAADEGSTATEIAFRYVLSQAMDVHPITGCQTVGEYVVLRRAAQRPLTPATVAWLETGGTVPH